jgi:hypothetical protein
MSFAIPMIAYICLLLYTLMYIRPRTQSLMVFPWMIIAVLITLPTWSPTPIGHEAIYASIYNGEDWEQGSTLAYPAMQLVHFGDSYCTNKNGESYSHLYW